MSLKSKILQSTLVGIGVFTCIILYGSYDSRRAHATEKEFCASVTAGMQLAGLQEKAIAMGANKRMTKLYESGSNELVLMATFNDIFIFDRYVCDISVADGKVTKVSQTHMD
jgi:hypothetical protein